MKDMEVKERNFILDERNGKRRNRTLTYLASSSTSNDALILYRALHNHNSIVQTPLDLRNELLRPAPEHESASFRLGTTLEEIEPLPSDLLLLEALARAQMVRLDVGARTLHRAAARLHHALQVRGGNPARAEHVAVGEELRGQVADGQLAEHDLGARGVQRLHLVVDELPLGVDDGLILGHALHAHLGVILFRFQLELDVQADDLGVGEDFRLLLEAGVGKGLFEGDAVDEERVLQAAAGDLFDADEGFVEVFLVERENGVDHHWNGVSTVLDGCCWLVQNALVVKKSAFRCISLLLMAVAASFLKVSLSFPSFVFTAISLILLTAISAPFRRPLMSVCVLTPFSTCSLSSFNISPANTTTEVVPSPTSASCEMAMSVNIRAAGCTIWSS